MNRRPDLARRCTLAALPCRPLGLDLPSSGVTSSAQLRR